MSKAAIFQSSNAKFQISRGQGEYITAAAALADPSLVIGRGLYVELWRDHEWKHITRVERQGDEIAFVYLETVQSADPGNSREGNVTTELTLTTVVERSSTFADGDEILIGVNAVARPKNRRHGKITTFVNEELED
ncbi:MAG: hypothetical protein SGJ27_00465 [Candidatus Melainabacteria bacterium]|nr:hypothetical protein [Candidatus Melainabacteria bacterium]